MRKPLVEEGTDELLPRSLLMSRSAAEVQGPGLAAGEGGVEGAELKSTSSGTCACKCVTSIASGALLVMTSMPVLASVGAEEARSWDSAACVRSLTVSNV